MVVLGDDWKQAQVSTHVDVVESTISYGALVPHEQYIIPYQLTCFFSFNAIAFYLDIAGESSRSCVSVLQYAHRTIDMLAKEGL